MPFGYKVYFTERPKNRVICWNPDTGHTSVVAGEPRNEDATQKLNDPYGLAIGLNGNLLIADKLNNRICRTHDGVLTTVDTKITDKHRDKLDAYEHHFDARLLSPTGLFSEPDGSILVAYSDDFTIYRVSNAGVLNLVLGVTRNHYYAFGMCKESVGSNEVFKVPLWGPTAITKRSDGAIFFIERGYQVIRQFDQAGLRTIFPLSAWYDHVVVNQEVSETTDFAQYHPAFPSTLALDASGNLYVGDTKQQAIFHVDFEANKVRRVVDFAKGKGALGGPAALCFGVDGTAWVVNSKAKKVEAYRPSQSGPWQPLGAVLDSHNAAPLEFHPAGCGLVCK